MRTGSLKKLDGLLTPAACALAVLAPKTRAVAGTTLVIRPGGLGDLVCADMALQAIGKDARQVNWLIETRSRAWAEYRGLPYFCYDLHPLKTLAAAISSHELVINSEQLFGLSQAYGLAVRARGGRLVSFGTNRGAKCADVTVPYDWKDAHEVREFSRLFSRALTGTEAAVASLARPRLQPRSAPPLVLMAGRQQWSRRLSVEEWTRVIATWHQERSFRIAAAPEDAAFADALERGFGTQAERFSGDFPELCAEIAAAEDFLTIDGGGVHIASYFGVPTRAIFTSGRDRKWAPLAAGSHVLRRYDLPCQPCTMFGQVPPCPNHFACRDMALARLDRIQP